jgi:hypothetical protein
MAFDKLAPDASDIVAVQLQSLALEPKAVVIGDGHAFRGKITVLKHYRGSGDFTDIGRFPPLTPTRFPGLGTT